MAADLVLAIDAGTTGVRVNAYDRTGAIVATRYREFTQHYPEPGWVEPWGGESLRSTCGSEATHREGRENLPTSR